MIAALELMATAVAAPLFGGDARDFGEAVSELVGADGQGGSFAVAKMTSTRFPLNIVPVELVAILATQNRWLDARWARGVGGSNVEAGALSNGDFAAFDANKKDP